MIQLIIITMLCSSSCHLGHYLPGGNLHLLDVACPVPPGAHHVNLHHRAHVHHGAHGHPVVSPVPPDAGGAGLPPQP